MIKTRLLAIGIVLVAIGIILVIQPDPFHDLNIVKTTIYPEKISLSSQTEIGNIIINAPLPASPAAIPMYSGYYDAGGRIGYTSPNWTKTKKSIPSVSEAPALAKKALVPYGGLPSDATVSSVSQTIGKSVDPVTLEFVPPGYPQATNIIFSREINGMPVVGTGQGIAVDLGENGELLYLSKNWRTLEKTGDASIITAKKAIEKFLQGEVVEAFQDPVDMTVTQIKLGYYESYPDRQEAILEPVWIFYGTTSTGNNYKFSVDAREYGSVLKFADFVASPTYGKSPLTVTFTDTSTGNVWDWYWDFGDGSSSAQKDPVHTYLKDGQYTVTLRVADEIRLDTMKKTSQILIGKKAIVMHTGTKLDEIINTLDTMNTDQRIKDRPLQKIRNAKAKNTDALKLIDQYMESQANDMLNDEDVTVQVFMSEVDSQTGGTILTERMIPTADAAKLNSGATEIRGLIQEAIGTPI